MADTPKKPTVPGNFQEHIEQLHDYVFNKPEENFQVFWELI